jgi:cyanophycinase
VLFVSPEEPLTAERLAALDATGVFVAGGLTSAYRKALFADTSWLDHVRRHGLPYMGYSAGAILASERAVMGGWILPLMHSNTEVAAQNYAEGLDFVELQDGFGLVPFAVEAHATQWGTLCRLLHMVGEGMLPGGWAIDEGCLMEVEGDELRIFGPNNAYRVRRLGDQSVRTDVFRAGTVLPRDQW